MGLLKFTDNGKCSFLRESTGLHVCTMLHDIFPALELFPTRCFLANSIFYIGAVVDMVWSPIGFKGMSVVEESKFLMGFPCRQIGQPRLGFCLCSKYTNKRYQ